ncbi:oligomeric complex COG6-domain-containing protein, partial [Baffinella frigidus]
VEVRQLLRVHHKTALMDIVDESSTLQVPPLVRRGIRALRSRAALYKECLADLAAGRRQVVLKKLMVGLTRGRPGGMPKPIEIHFLTISLHRAILNQHVVLLKKFMVALTRGGPGGMPKPIEIHAHDPMRYVGDMLAWVHQSIASERELLSALLAAARDEPASGTGEPVADEGAKGTTPAEVKAEEDAVLAAVLDAVGSTVQARLEAVLKAQHGSVMVFKLGNLLLFYLHTIGGLLARDAKLTAALQGLHKLAGRLFMESITQTAQRLYKQPPAVPAGLGPHTDIANVLQELAEVMSSFDGSLIPARLREGYFKPVLDESIEPLIAGASLTANAIAAGEGAIYLPRGASLSANAIAAGEGAIYLLNCLLAVQTLLQRFDFCAWRLPKLQQQISAAQDQGVSEQVVAVMRTFNLDEKMYALRAHRAAVAAAGGVQAGPLSVV